MKSENTHLLVGCQACMAWQEMDELEMETGEYIAHLREEGIPHKLIKLAAMPSILREGIHDLLLFLERDDNQGGSDFELYRYVRLEPKHPIKEMNE